MTSRAESSRIHLPSNENGRGMGAGKSYEKKKSGGTKSDAGERSRNGDLCWYRNKGGNYQLSGATRKKSLPL